jgi:outer membrane protein OmpA-like peptidoglycan-associated protein
MTAHREGSIELSFGAGVLTLDQALSGQMVQSGIATATSRIMPGGALRLGYNFSQSLGLSVGSAFGSGQGASAIAPFAALTFTSNINKKMSPFFTVGAGVTRFSGSGNRITSTYGAHGGVGIRSMMGENLALRIEGRMAYENYDELAGGTGAAAYNGTALIGLSYFSGGGPPRDTDGDGVPDKRDRCASTARGATVDIRGCPSDTDHDGVLNGLDRCPNTPASTPVDANGCTRDTDGDAIADNLDRCPNTPSGVRVDASGCPLDTDHDGVTDNNDRCANTPAGTPVDANGCPRDTDGDGVLDNADRCPATPAGTPVDVNGCPRDSDADGVTDNNDRCPNTAAGTQVDATGCPVARDADHDGVIDDRDRCANTPTGRQVDANGCPLAELPSATTPIVLRNVLFRPGTARLLPSSGATLDPIAAAIVANAGTRFEVGGHTDALGVPASNLRLSQSRAQAVMDYLVSKGVPAASLTAVGYGPQHPVAPNTTAAGRAQNRRVELKRL